MNGSTPPASAPSATKPAGDGRPVRLWRHWHTVGQKIQTEDFDNGGFGVAYSDASLGNGDGFNRQWKSQKEVESWAELLRPHGKAG